MIMFYMAKVLDEFEFMAAPLLGALGGVTAILIDYSVSAQSSLMFKFAELLQASFLMHAQDGDLGRFAALALVILGAAAGITFNSRGRIAGFIGGFVVLSIANLLLPASL